MKTVDIPLRGKFKCIVLENVKTGEKILRANGGEFHSEVRDEVLMLEDLDSDDWRMRGGGRVVVSKPHKLVKVYGYSVDFGHMDGELVQEMMEPFSEELGYEFINECGIGY